MLLGNDWLLLLLSRLLSGMVAGIVTGVVPRYFAEISPRSARGTVGVAHQLAITTGILVAQVLTAPSLAVLGEAPAAWRAAFYGPILCAGCECLLLPFCPGELHWLGLLLRRSVLGLLLGRRHLRHDVARVWGHPHRY